MAGKDAIYAKYNPEVFEVGREQAIQLLHAGWQADIFRYRCEYLIVASLTYFGDWNHPARPSDVREYAGHDTLDAAIADVEKSHAIDMEELFSKSRYDGYEFFAPGWDYEVWHLVDDGELWDEWEFKVRMFKELAERKEEETRKLYSGELFKVNVPAFVSHLNACQNVKRDMSEIVRIGRLITGSLGGGYELHDFVNYDRLHMLGSIWEMCVYDGCTFHVWRFPSERVYLDFVERHEDMFAGFGSFVYRYLYNEEGVFGYEDMQSDEGVKTIWESVPGGELDEEIVF